MIVKFRESHIKKLELKLKKEKVDESGEEDSRDKEIVSWIQGAVYPLPSPPPPPPDRTPKNFFELVKSPLA